MVDANTRHAGKGCFRLSFVTASHLVGHLLRGLPALATRQKRGRRKRRIRPGLPCPQNLRPVAGTSGPPCAPAPGLQARQTAPQAPARLNPSPRRHTRRQPLQSGAEVSAPSTVNPQPSPPSSSSMAPAAAESTLSRIAVSASMSASLNCKSSGPSSPPSA